MFSSPVRGLFTFAFSSRSTTFRASRRACRRTKVPARCASEAAVERDVMEYDVVTIGAGPAGLAAAIRLKQLSKEQGKDLSVCVVEKGAEVGAHILSGNVLEPRALDELIPDWRDKGAPIQTPVTEDTFLFLTGKEKSFRFPTGLLPPQQQNHGNYIISLSQLCRWLAEQAEQLGVEIYPGFSAAEVLYDSEGAVTGVATRDVGIAKDGSRKETFQPGVELRGKQTLFAEGARGSCSEAVMKKYDLRANCHVQTYGLGVKEIWEVPEENHKPGLVMHTLGWPVQHGLLDKTFGGSFLYHMKPNLVLLGLVIGLDYQNPYINIYKEFQRLKLHPDIFKHIEGGQIVSYGARVLNEGGYHAIPKLTFPGGALIGCAAGFLNAVKIKGTHTAIKSGMLAAEAVFDLLTLDADKQNREAVRYQEDIKKSWVYKELKEVRNVHAAFTSGLLPGTLYAGLATHLTKGREPWILSNEIRDADRTRPAKEFKPIEYPKPDGSYTFDLLTNLQRSGTYHEHDQPSHLRVKPELASVPPDLSYPEYSGPEQRFCPAGVYEYKEADAEGKHQLVINAQNCVHCKCCDIKMPKEYINWTVPEGGGGPAYTLM